MRHALLLALTLLAPARAQQTPPPAPAPAKPEAGKPAPAKSPDAIPPPLKEYLGRTIAPTMSYEGGPWLMRGEREKEEECARLLAALHLKPGDVVADIGCGNGFYTFRLGAAVGAKGRVDAVDVQPEMLALLKEEAKRHAEVKNVVPILGTTVDPKLAAASIDLAFLVDVYHEFDHPVEMLAALKRALKPGGRIVLVEFRLEDPKVPIKLLHKMSKAQMKRELAANGFDVAEEFDGLPWQHVVFFTPHPDPPAPAKDGPAKDGPAPTKRAPSDRPNSGGAVQPVRRDQ